MNVHGRIIDLFRIAAKRSPSSTALEWRETRWSYQGLSAAAACAAEALRRAGVSPGSRVGLLFRNCPHYVASYYGAMAAGCVVVPLNPQDRAAVLALQLRHCEATVLLGDPAQIEWRELAEVVTAQGGTVTSVPVQDLSSAEAFIAFMGGSAEAEGGSARRTHAHDVATIIYTSGTTGQPKGVMLSHGNLGSNTSAVVSYLGLTSADVGLCVLPFQFSYGNSVLHTHLAAGAKLLIEDNFAFPAATLRKMQENAVTGFSGVPSTFALMLARCHLADYDLRNLRYITQAGGPMPPATIRRLMQELPGVQIFVMYGQTEATARLTYLPPALIETKLGSVGIGIPGTEIVVRRDDGTEAAAGESGEICARGPNIMLGYWRNRDLSGKAVRDGCLYTGDLGHKDSDGFLYIDGRSADMIKIGAFRVSPQEIEEVIAELESVEEVGVASMPDPLLGQVARAFIVPRADSALTAREVRAHCHRRLAAYKVPKAVEFTSVLPRTSSGKIQRHKLAALGTVTSNAEHA